MQIHGIDIFNSFASVEDEGCAPNETQTMLEKYAYAKKRRFVELKLSTPAN